MISIQHKRLKKILPYAAAAVASLLLFAISMHFSMPALVRRTQMYAVLFAADIYLWFKLNDLLSSKFKNNRVAFCTFALLYWSFYFILMGLVILQWAKGTSAINNPDFHNWKGLCTMVYIFKLLVAGLLLVFDLIVWGIRKHKGSNYQPAIAQYILAILSGLTIFFTGIAIWGMTFAAHHFIVRPVTLTTEHLAFKDKPMRLVHISDIHLGTWRNPATIQEIADIIKQQKADMVIFTGDMVQCSSKEMLPYLDILKQVKAPLGVYSILGNHDYGTYSNFKTEEARITDMDKLAQYHQQIGWTLLRNENIRQPWNGDSITIAGIEFWSAEPTNINTGNPTQTFLGVNDSDFTILLSHTPEMWEEIINTQLPANLTLSGHTHGMQAGILTQKFRFSPAALMYKYWGGLYTQANGQALYVNPGLASCGMPARFGMYPEITVIEIIHNEKK